MTQSIYRKTRPVYKKGAYSAHRFKHLPGYIIKKDGYTLILPDGNPMTYNAMQMLIDDLARCPVCHDERVIICRKCGGAKQAVSGKVCHQCDESGRVVCPACG